MSEQNRSSKRSFKSTLRYCVNGLKYFILKTTAYFILAVYRALFAFIMLFVFIFLLFSLLIFGCGRTAKYMSFIADNIKYFPI